MNNTLRKIGIILIAVIVVPALLFVTFELSSLNSNEKVIEKIYESQLDAILFSVNQYSQDIMDSWAGKIETELSVKKDSVNFREFLDENTPVDGIIIGDLNRLTILNSYDDVSGQINKLSMYKKILEAKSDLINKLVSYRQSGYRKIEPLFMDSLTTSLIFTFTSPGLKNEFCILVINTNSFIQKILSPRIEAISKRGFAIQMYPARENSNNEKGSEIDFGKGTIQKEMWLIPDYRLGISLTGETIDSLVNQRAFTNLSLIVVLIIVLLIGIYIVFRNVRKEIEISQMKSDFVSNVSHELKTPLAMISMFAETLEMGRVRTEEKKQEYYRIITQETTRLSRIVSSILNFSKIEAGKRSYSFIDSFLNDIVDNVFVSYKTHLEQNGFEAIIEKDETIPVQKLDEEAVSEAVMNLLDNAVKYSKNDKKISVKTGFNNGYSYVEVKDFGIGIPKNVQKKIFEKFFRVSSGLVHNVKGTGLGLSIVKHIMDAHHGLIEIESEPGRGSMFRLKFPLEKINS